MPKYTLPPLKKSKPSKEAGLVGAYDDSEWRRRITIPVNRAIIEAVKAGQDVKITLNANLIGTQMAEHKDRPNDCHIEVSLSSVSVYPAEESPSEHNKRRLKETY